MIFFCNSFVPALVLAAGLLASSQMADGHVIYARQSGSELQSFCDLTDSLRSHAVLRGPLLTIKQIVNNYMRQEDMDLSRFVRQSYPFTQERTLENLAVSLTQTMHNLACMREALRLCNDDRVSGLVDLFRQLVLESTYHQGQGVPMPRCHSRQGECTEWKNFPEQRMVYGHRTVTAALKLVAAMNEECSGTDGRVN